MHLALLGCGMRGLSIIFLVFSVAVRAELPEHAERTLVQPLRRAAVSELARGADAATAEYALTAAEIRRLDAEWQQLSGKVPYRPSKTVDMRDRLLDLRARESRLRARADELRVVVARGAQNLADLGIQLPTIESDVDQWRALDELARLTREMRGPYFRHRDAIANDDAIRELRAALGRPGAATARLQQELDERLLRRAELIEADNHRHRDEDKLEELRHEMEERAKKLSSPSLQADWEAFAEVLWLRERVPQLEVVLARSPGTDNERRLAKARRALAEAESTLRERGRQLPADGQDLAQLRELANQLARERSLLDETGSLARFYRRRAEVLTRLRPEFRAHARRIGLQLAREQRVRDLEGAVRELGEKIGDYEVYARMQAVDRERRARKASLGTAPEATLLAALAPQADRFAALLDERRAELVEKMKHIAAPKDLKSLRQELLGGEIDYETAQLKIALAPATWIDRAHAVWDSLRRGRWPRVDDELARMRERGELRSQRLAAATLQLQEDRNTRRRAEYAGACAARLARLHEAGL